MKYKNSCLFTRLIVFSLLIIFSRTSAWKINNAAKGDSAIFTTACVGRRNLPALLAVVIECAAKDWPACTAGARPKYQQEKRVSVKFYYANVPTVSLSSVECVRIKRDHIRLSGGGTPGIDRTRDTYCSRWSYSTRNSPLHYTSTSSVKDLQASSSSDL